MFSEFRDEKLEIIVFGYSITAGAYDIEGGWVSRMRKDLTRDYIEGKRRSCFVYNLSVSGDTTNGLLLRMESELKARNHDRKKVIIFALGINDSAIYKNSQNQVSIKDFESNLNQLKNLAEIFSDKIIFLGLTPVDESLTRPVAWNSEISYRNSEILKYDMIIQELSKANDINYIRLFESFKNYDQDDLLFDGVHPNTKGHKLIFTQVKKFLQ